MNLAPSCDAYALLGVDPDADDETLRTAYHDRIRRQGADPALNAAWVHLRDPAARERHRWCDPTALLALPPAADARPLIDDLPALVRELASASDWELRP